MRASPSGSQAVKPCGTKSELQAETRRTGVANANLGRTSCTSSSKTLPNKGHITFPTLGAKPGTCPTVALDGNSPENE